MGRDYRTSTRTPNVVCWCVIERKRHAFSCESATDKRSTLQQKERHHGEEDKKESESEEEKVIFRLGIKLPLMPIGLETLVGTSAAGNIQPLFIETGVP
jgi:hypothetical protein